ncbi:MAG: RNHCP domain-containing protein [Treponema sp.]
MSRIQSIIRECTEAFICLNCGRTVPPVLSGGKNRNHCPHCLYSRHEDILPGDRRSPCRGRMRPIAVWVKDNGEWYIVHRCEKCGTIRTNRIAADDDENVLLRLALKAVTNLPFPLEVCHEC